MFRWRYGNIPRCESGINLENSQKLRHSLDIFSPVLKLRLSSYLISGFVSMNKEGHRLEKTSRSDSLNPVGIQLIGYVKSVPSMSSVSRHVFSLRFSGNEYRSKPRDISRR